MFLTWPHCKRIVTKCHWAGVSCASARAGLVKSYGNVSEMSWKKRVLLFVSVWTLLGLFFASRSILIYSYAEQDFDWRLPLKLSLAEWYGWALLAPAIIWLARRFAFARESWKKSLGIHLAAGLLIATVKVVLDAYVQPLIGGFPANLAYKLHTNLVTYASVVAVIQAALYYRKYRERELKASQLEARLAQSQLQVLKSELHPHFLFNTLHAISTLMHRDVGAADRMLARLSDLLRHSFEHIGQQETTLKAELEFLALYVEIEQMRFGDRLSVDVDADPETLDLAVPAFLLQPLVENAIRHAVAPRAAGGAVEIQASRLGDTLRIEVRDDGPGFPTAPAGQAGLAQNGIGLSNTRARLEQLYGASHRFELVNFDAPSQGAICRIELPARVHGGAPT